MADGGGMDPADDPRLNTQADAALDRLRSALAAAGEDPAAAVALVERLAAKAPSAAAGARTVGTEVAALLAAARLLRRGGPTHHRRARRRAPAPGGGGGGAGGGLRRIRRRRKAWFLPPVPPPEGLNLATHLVHPERAGAIASLIHGEARRHGDGRCCFNAEGQIAQPLPPSTTFELLNKQHSWTTAFYPCLRVPASSVDKRSAARSTSKMCRRLRPEGGGTERRFFPGFG